jgi:hypothetical protein
MAIMLCATTMSTTHTASLDSDVYNALRTSIAFSSVASFGVCHISPSVDGNPSTVASTGPSLLTPRLHVHTTPVTLPVAFDVPFAGFGPSVQPHCLQFHEDLNVVQRRWQFLRYWTESACSGYVPGLDRDLATFDTIVGELHESFAWSLQVEEGDSIVVPEHPKY